MRGDSLANGATGTSGSQNNGGPADVRHTFGCDCHWCLWVLPAAQS
jgi:hypothetical protein